LFLPETQLLDKTRFPIGFFDKENYGDNFYQKQYQKEMAKKKA